MNNDKKAEGVESPCPAGKVDALAAADEMKAALKDAVLYRDKFAAVGEFLRSCRRMIDGEDGLDEDAVAEDAIRLCRDALAREGFTDEAAQEIIGALCHDIVEEGWD